MIAYIRLSTKGQEDGYGIDTQKNEIDAWATAHNKTISRYVLETGSGAKERPLLEELIYSCDEDIVVFKFDRIARDTQLFFYYLYQLKKKELNVYSTQEEITDEVMSNIYMAFHQFAAERERANITLRTSKGRKVKASSGGYSGGKAPYGYMVKDGCLVVNPKEREIIKRVFESRESLRDTANMLNSLGFKTRGGKDFTFNQVRSILSNKDFYTGTYSYGGITSKGDYELCL